MLIVLCAETEFPVQTSMNPSGNEFSMYWNRAFLHQNGNYPSTSFSCRLYIFAPDQYLEVSKENDMNDIPTSKKKEMNIFAVSHGE